MESVKTNEGELTSTMGSLMSMNKDNKNEASDSTPTSSTDAFTTTSTSQIVADDPISSTSSDVMDSNKSTEKVDYVAHTSINVVSNSTNLSTSPIVSEKDLLDMNITDTSTEKITENVDDIVQDLENLLGEPTTSFSFTMKAKEGKDFIEAESRDISMDIDDFSAQLQELSDKSKQEKNEEIKKSQTLESVKNREKIQSENQDSQVEIDIKIEPTEIIEKNDDVTSTILKSEISEEKLETTKIEKLENTATKNLLPIEETEKQEIQKNSETLVVIETQPTALEVKNIEPQATDKISQVSESTDVETDLEVEKIQAIELSEAETTKQNVDESNKSESEIKDMEVQNINKGAKAEIKKNQEPEEIEVSQQKERSEEVIQTQETIEEIQEPNNTAQIEEITENHEQVEENKQQVSEDKMQEETITVVVTDEIQKTAIEVVESVKEPTKIIDEKTQEVSIQVVDKIKSEEVEEKMQENASKVVGTKTEIVEEKMQEATTQIIEKKTEIVEEKMQEATTQIIEKKTEIVEEQMQEVTTPIVEEKAEIAEEQMQESATQIVEEKAEIAEEQMQEPTTLIVEKKTEVEDQTEATIQLVEEKTEIIKDKTPEATIQETIQEETITEVVEQTEIVQEKMQEVNEEKTEVVEEKRQETTTPEVEEKIQESLTPTVVAEETTSEVIKAQETETDTVTSSDNKEIEVETKLAEISNQILSRAVDLTPVELQEIIPEENQSFVINNESIKENVVMSSKSENIETEVEQKISEQDVPISVEIVPESLILETEDTNLEVAPVDFIPDSIEVATPNLVHDLDLLVQNTVNDQLDKKTTTEVVAAPIESNILPLSVEEVTDLEVLNAISTLSNYKSTPENLQNVQQSDALLTSSTLAQTQTTEVPFEANVESIQAPVEEIFNEPAVDLPDDNLETLLAVANLQTDYVQPVEDFVPEEITVVEDLKNDFPASTQPPNELVETINEPSKMKESKQQGINLKEPLVINIDDNDKDRVYSPKITIKPIKPPDGEETIDEIETTKGSLKMTITKQSDNMHSILKIYNPDDDNEEPSVPKLIIKPILQPNEQPQSPKISTRSSKVFSPSTSSNQRSASPRITIKPIPKPEESVAPLKITIKPVLNESHKQKHSPKLTIKPIVKPDEETIEPKVQSPRVTIKPIVKPPDDIEQVASPRITIKPIVKPAEIIENVTPRLTIKPVKEKTVEIVEQMERSSPKITIKPIVKPQDENLLNDVVEKTSPKITIKPIVKPQDNESLEDTDDSIKERIVLKINKGTIPTSSKESRKPEEEKLTKIKLKFSKEGGHPQIIQEPIKRQADQIEHDKTKRQRVEEQFLTGVNITPIAPSTHSKLKEMLSRGSDNKIVTIEDDDDVTIIEEQIKNSPIVISEESNQDSMNTSTIEIRDPISEIPVFEITPDCVKTLNTQAIPPVVDIIPNIPPAPRKRGRPRKVPLQVREDFKDPKEEEPKPVIIESSRPKRSCRGQSVRTTLGIKPRKPRGPGRGRGSKRGMGTRSTPTPPATPPRIIKDSRLKEDTFLLSDKSEDDGLLRAPHPTDHSIADRADIVMYEEETRMSAETSSRAQTPAKQVTVDLVEESQSSVQSTATTESVKVRKGPRLEVHQEPEGAVISADQLAEYYWMGGGPYMLQEQVAQFLGIKSFKRKYPNIPRRVVDMQERDFIRESGLACESMCDLGLTAVNSSDILDIMYSDFQDKYEEYCKHQRDRQAKDLINKQRALTLAASQEKAKLDITQQAVQSAANWNATFNKARKDQRKSCMDLQTLTIHFPKGKMKQISKPKIGFYPVALVPGQFTDYYREFTPTEINNLPLNTLCYNRLIRGVEMECDSQTDGSGSESDTTSSDSDSSYSGSSDGEDCTLCKHTPKRITV